MSAMPRVFAALLAMTLAFIAQNARADIYALSHDEASNAMVITATSDGGAGAARVPACCAIAIGSPTFDTAQHRAYFIEEAPAGANLVRLDYLTGASSRLPVSAGYRVTHLEYDATGARLLALARDAVTENLVMAAIDPATGALSVRANLAAPCCVLRAGVSVLTTSGGTRLLTVGRAAAANEELLIFDFVANTGPQAVTIPGDLKLGDLARHPLSGAVFGVAHDETADVTRVITVGAAPSYPIATVGTGATACCFGLAGASAIDRTSGEIVFIGSVSGSTLPAVQRFNVVTGARVAGIALAGNAVFEDFGVSTGVLFADGFE